MLLAPYGNDQKAFTIFRHWRDRTIEVRLSVQWSGDSHLCDFFLQNDAFRMGQK